MHEPARRIPKPEAMPPELEKLQKIIEELPMPLRAKLLPLIERLAHYIKLQSRSLILAQEEIGQFQLDAAYLKLDLEATRRERDALFDELHGDGDSV